MFTSGSSEPSNLTNRKTKRETVVIFAISSLFMLAVVNAEAAESARAVSIHSSCSDKISSAVVSALNEEVQMSTKYRVVRSLSDDGKMDLVLTIQMNCAERGDVAAIATIYGQAKCFSTSNCHLATDGLSLRSDLCDSKAVVECGRELFKAFDTYVSNPLSPQLRLN